MATVKNHLAAIHIAQKALGLSKDDAEALKLAVTGLASAAGMSDLQRRRYLAHLSGLQAQAVLARGEVPAYVPKRPAIRPSLHYAIDDDADARWSKARALWHALALHGEVRTDTDAALQAYIKSKVKVDAWRFLNTFQINQVIEMLKKWCHRVGAPVTP